jgi:hypothetical protein
LFLEKRWDSGRQVVTSRRDSSRSVAMAATPAYKAQ